MPPKEITLGSLFDGIAGFPYAAGLHGIRSVWASEIEPFCIKVSQKHFPEMKHLGSITDIHACYYVTHFSGYKCEMYINNHKDISVEPLDIITFGSPCQDLSVAGKRKGLTGERSGLFMEAIRIIREMREATNGLYPTFAVWENVPGAFSSNRGQDFRAVLEEIMETEIPMPKSGKWANAGMVRGNGRSVAWRVLDAQYWGVPQRRRRIFLVADFAGQRAPEILFEPQGVPGDTAEGGKARQETAAGAGDGVETTSYRVTEFGRYIESDYAGPVKARDYKDATDLIAVTLTGKDKARCLTARADSSPCVDRGQNVVLAPQPIALENHPADSRIKIEESGKVQTLTSRMGTGGGNVPMLMHPIAFQPGNLSRRAGAEPSEKAFPTLGATTQGDQFPHVATCYDPKDLGRRPATFEDKSPTIKARCGTGGNNIPVTQIGYAVRRLTPIECLRLQGFPDNWLTDIPGYSDTAAYKAIGNSLAIPPTKWIMGRIKAAIMGELCPNKRI